MLAARLPDLVLVHLQNGKDSQVMDMKWGTRVTRLLVFSQLYSVIMRAKRETGSGPLAGGAGFLFVFSPVEINYYCPLGLRKHAWYWG